MKFINILLSGWVILSIKTLFSHGNDLYQLIVVKYVKEVYNDGEQLFLKTYPDVDFAKFSEEKRLELCRGGIRHAQKYNLLGLKGKEDLPKKSSPETFKVYAVSLFNSHTTEITILPAFKCSNNPAMYIRMSFTQKNEQLQNTYQIIYQVSRPRPAFDLIMYEMQLIRDIAEVNMAEFDGSKLIFNAFPDFDTDEFSEEQRFQICKKAMEAVSPLEIKLLSGSKISSNKYYTVTLMVYGQAKLGKAEKMMKEALECPTDPKVYITVKEGETRNVVKLLVMMKAVDKYQTTKNVKKMKAVSGQTVAELSYLQIREANSSTKKLQIIDPSTQYALCKTIFNETILQKLVERSDYQVWGMSTPLCYVHFIRPSDTYEELRDKHPNLWKRLYKPSDSVLIPGQDVSVLAGTESVDISVPDIEGKMQEDVFVCLTEQESGAIKEYFVSNEYNMNASNSSKSYIAGRFVLEKNPSNNNMMEIVAMVEEFAEPLEVANIELLYLKERKSYEPANIDVEDPLCELSSLDKSRLCTIVYDYLIIFKKPTPLHQNLGCAKNLITFKTEDGKKAANGKLYHEYMLPCYIGTQPKGEDQFMYYLSRSVSPTHPNAVFAYYQSSMNANVVLFNLYNDLRIGSFFEKK